jgi:hypothetical protein
MATKNNTPAGCDPARGKCEFAVPCVVCNCNGTSTGMQNYSQRIVAAIQRHAYRPRHRRQLAKGARR